METGLAGAFVLLIAGLIGLLSAAATASITGCWSSRLERDGLSWDLGLDISWQDGELVATIDVAALWRAGESLPSFDSDGRSVRFELPWSMGSFAGRLAGDRLPGEVTFQDARQEALVFRRAGCSVARSEEIGWRIDDVSIAATLTLPAGKGPFPAVVILHGAGDSSRESPAYRFWSEYLPRLGIACLVYDKRGNGQSTGSWREVGFEQRARDVVGGLAMLRARRDLDAGRLGLLAVSQGSWVAGLVARMDPGVGFVVHVSGPAVPVAEADGYSLESELRRQGRSEEEIAKRSRLWKLEVEVTRDPGSDEAWRRLQEAIDEARGDSWFATDPYEPQRYSPWRSWYQRVADHDPRPLLEGLDVPMLWLFGAMDGQSDPAKNVAVLEQLRRRGKDYTIALYPAAGHGLLVPVDSRGRDGGLLTTAPGFFADLERWLRRQTLAAEPTRSFDSGTFTSLGLPKVAIRLDDGFRYLGRRQFDLPGQARVDRHHFVDVGSDGRLERLVVLHFEGFLPQSDEIYRYGIPSPENAAGPDYRFTLAPVPLGEHEYIHNTWFFDARKAIEAEPDRELARTARLLEAHGHALPDEVRMSRFVRVVDERARHEMIIFYFEPLAPTGLRAAQFVAGGAGAAVLDRLSAELTARSLAAFSVEPD